MNTKRIEEIQKETAYPDSISVQQALLKVWNECEQGKVVNKNDLLPDVSNRNPEIVVCDCGWKGYESELKLKKVTIIANCPEDIEVCPKCENEWIT